MLPTPYEDMFKNLQKIADQEIKPSALSCNFETAVIKTVEKIFSSTKIQLFRFHFYQSVKQHAKRRPEELMAKYANIKNALNQYDN